jgi:hypothetical protein
MALPWKGGSEKREKKESKRAPHERWLSGQSIEGRAGRTIFPSF